MTRIRQVLQALGATLQADLELVEIPEDLKTIGDSKRRLTNRGIVLRG
jgi:hypothetical protein